MGINEPAEFPTGNDRSSAVRHPGAILTVSGLTKKEI